MVSPFTKLEESPLMSGNTYIPAMEMIDPQLNDPVVYELNEAFEELITVSTLYKNRLVSGLDFFKNCKKTKAAIDKIDNIISNRFGFTAKHMNGAGIGYGVMTSPPIGQNVLSGDVEKMAKHIKKAAKSGKRRLDCSTGSKAVECRPEGVNDMYLNAKSMLHIRDVTFDALNETMGTKGIKLDLKRARIDGLPKEYVVFFVASLEWLIHDFKLTAKELTAVLLHEVGHAFTHIENAYRTVQTTTLILDNITNGLNGGKSKLDVLHLINEDVLKMPKEDRSNNTSIMAVRVIDNFVKETYKLHKNDLHSVTDSEQLADQFTTRFGVGRDTTSALTKMMRLEGPKHQMTEYKWLNTIIIAVLATVLVILLFIFIIPVMIYGAIVLLLGILLGGNDAHGNTYDSKYRRFKRMRNDKIRMIRTSGLSKEHIAKLIEQVDGIDTIMDAVFEGGNEDKSLLETISNRTIPSYRRISSHKQFEQLLEDLSENELHLISAKLNTLK